MPPGGYPAPGYGGPSAGFPQPGFPEPMPYGGAPGSQRKSCEFV